MTRQILNRGTIANDGTGDTLRTASLKIEQNFEELYNKLGDGSVLMSLLDFDSDAIVFEGRTADQFQTRLRADDPTADRQVYIPNYDGHLVMDSATQTLANKTLTSPFITTPKINNTSGSHQYNIAVSAISNDRTITLPLLGANDTLVFNNHTATLTNKTLQLPTINSPIIGDEIRDSSGNELLVFSKVGGAINYIEVGNNSTGNAPTLTGKGETNTSIAIAGSGTGGVKINSKIILETDIETGSGDIIDESPVTLLSNNGTSSHTLNSGVSGNYGELKYIVATGTGTKTINESGNNLAAYSSITMTQNTSVTLIWFNSQWVVVNNQGATLNV